MKKLVISLILLSTLLAACSGAATATPVEATTDLAATAVVEILSTTQTAMASAQQGSEATTKAALSADYTDAAPVYLQLILGVMKLEGTDQVITADQAAAMLALVSSLQTSEASAEPTATDGQPQPNRGMNITQEQVDAFVEQVAAILNNNQIQAIAAMQITQESSKTIMEELGMNIGGPGKDGTVPDGGTPQADGGQMPQGTPPAGGPDGQGGGPGGGGGAPGDGGQAPTGEQMATPEAGQMDESGMMLQPQLIEAVITYLQGKTS